MPHISKEKILQAYRLKFRIINCCFFLLYFFSFKFLLEIEVEPVKIPVEDGEDGIPPEEEKVPDVTPVVEAHALDEEEAEEHR